MLENDFRERNGAMCSNFYGIRFIEDEKEDEEDFEEETSIYESFSDDDDTDEQYRRYREQQETEEEEYRNYCYEMDWLEAHYYGEDED